MDFSVDAYFRYTNNSKPADPTAALTKQITEIGLMVKGKIEPFIGVLDQQTKSFAIYEGISTNIKLPIRTITAVNRIWYRSGGLEIDVPTTDWYFEPNRNLIMFHELPTTNNLCFEWVAGYVDWASCPQWIKSGWLESVKEHMTMLTAQPTFAPDSRGLGSFGKKYDRTDIMPMNMTHLDSFIAERFGQSCPGTAIYPGVCGPAMPPEFYEIQSGTTPDPASTVFTAIAGENLSGGRVVIVAANGMIYHADSSNVAHAGSVIGMVTGAVTSGATATVETEGIITGLSGLTPGMTYFFNNTGALAATAPVTGFSQAVGVAKSATELSIELDEATILS